MRNRKVTLGPTQLLTGTVLGCDSDLWRALIGSDDLVVASDGPLADWVRSIALARQWTVDVLQDPREVLKREFPSLAPYASELLPTGTFVVSRPLWIWAQDVLGSVPRATIPSRDHAEQVARWKVGRELSNAHRALLKSALADFSGSTESELYSFVVTASDTEIIESLAGEKSPAFSTEYASDKEPNLAKELGAWTRTQLALVGFDGIRKAISSTAPNASKVAIAKSVVAVAMGVDFPPDAMRLLSKFLSHEESERLLEFIEPPAPRQIPNSSIELGDWYRSSYLPYRKWMHAKGIDSGHVIEPVWEQFATVFLSEFAKSVGSGQGELAMHRSRHLRQAANRSVLVVLDGPLPWDVDHLLARLKELSSDWGVADLSWILSAVPTITEVCRPSVVCGDVAINAIMDDAVTSFTKAKSQIENSKSFVVVKLEEPDKAYHSLGEPPERLRRLARSKMELIAEDLSELLTNGTIDAVYVTADHGRCMGKVNPIVPNPETEVQGRAALNVLRKTSVNSSFARKLDGELYGFSSDMDAIVLTGNAGFQEVKQTWYLHGGLLPEEAFVPWIELRKVAASPDLTVEFSISGSLNRSGELALTVINHSPLTIRLMNAQWFEGEQLKSYDLNEVSVLGANQKTLKIELQSIVETYSTMGQLVVSTPEGLIVSFDALMKSNVRRMQTQNIDLLDDL